nr:RibD C-terminal domain protein [uncultured bacterium]
MTEIRLSNRPHTTLVLAMSADGKIADATRSPTLFGSPVDKVHLEKQIAAADGVLGGAGSLRVGGTAMRLIDPELLQQREQEGKPPQPVQIIVSRTGEIDPGLPFFRQPVPRWLLTTSAGANRWNGDRGFERILAIETPQHEIDLSSALQQMAKLGLERLAVMGGGQLVASLLAEDLIDELWLTVCPVLIGGATAPTPVDGAGFSTKLAPRLELLEVKPFANEVFLHYRLRR